MNLPSRSSSGKLNQNEALYVTLGPLLEVIVQPIPIPSPNFVCKVPSLGG
jgi:hypothetical protein